MVALAAPAGADAHLRSGVVAVDYRASVVSPDPAVKARVYQSDRALSVAAEAGHTVVILGYLGEPFVRIGAGRVAVNAASLTAAGLGLLGGLASRHGLALSLARRDVRVARPPAARSSCGRRPQALGDSARRRRALGSVDRRARTSRAASGLAVDRGRTALRVRDRAPACTSAHVLGASGGSDSRCDFGRGDGGDRCRVRVRLLRLGRKVGRGGERARFRAGWDRVHRARLWPRSRRLQGAPWASSAWAWA